MTSYLPVLNKNVYQYQLTVHEKFQEIYRPLLGLGMKGFDYYKIFSNGSYLALMHNLEFSRVYLDTIRDVGLTFTNEFNQIQKGKAYYINIFLKDIEQFNKAKDPIPYLLYDFNMKNIFVICKLNNLEYVECYAFYMPYEGVGFHNFSLGNLPFLEHFCNYFNERAKDLIDSSDKTKLGVFDQIFKFDQTSQKGFLSKNIQKFLQETSLEKRNLKIREKDIFFTKRETECLEFLSLGKTTKEIARILDLSPRSVDFYFQNLKKKTGLSRRKLVIYLTRANTFII